MGWTNVPKDISNYQGFVYIITHKPTGKYYVGKKNFWFRKTQPPLKGNKNKRHTVVESDWKSYWGSSKEFLAFVQKQGTKSFTRKILHHCKTKWDMSYNELLEQISRNVLFDSKSYNGIINVRLRRRNGTIKDT